MNAAGSKLSLLVAIPLALATGACEESVSGPSDLEEVALQMGNALLGDESDVILTAEADAFESGADVTLVLEHRSGDAVGYNLCFHGLERRSGGDWIVESGLQICTAELRILEAGEAAEHETALPGDLAGGEYRYRIALYLIGEQAQRDQVSEAFVVE